MKTINGPIPQDFPNDLTWLTNNLKFDGSLTVAEARLVDFSGTGGWSGEMRKLFIKFSDGSEKSFCVKNTADSKLKTSLEIGLAREGIFYECFLDEIISGGISVPRVYYAYGDMSVGRKEVILDDLSDHVQSGYFFGPYSPHNWGKDLKSITTGCFDENWTDVQVIKAISTVAVTEAANLHGLFWRRKSLCEYSWLRGVDWVKGVGKDTWVAAQNTALACWNTTKGKFGNSDYGVKWDPFLLECMEASFAKISWEKYLEDASLRPWTLVHGDFHPANMLLSIKGKDLSTLSLKLVDWEMVGLGSGPQDIAQFMISHVCPADRRACEHELLQQYFNTLMAHSEVRDDSSFSWDMCLQEYQEGGTGRWVWLLALLTTMCPDSMTQFFHDQVLAFIRDHGITPTRMPMPRV